MFLFDIIPVWNKPSEFTEFTKTENKRMSLFLYANKMDLVSQTGSGLNTELILLVSFAIKRSIE